MTFIVQKTSDGNHTLAFCAEAEDSPDNGGLLLVDLAFDMIAHWPAIGIENGRTDLDIVSGHLRSCPFVRSIFWHRWQHAFGTRQKIGRKLGSFLVFEIMAQQYDEILWRA